MSAFYSCRRQRVEFTVPFFLLVPVGNELRLRLRSFTRAGRQRVEVSAHSIFFLFFFHPCRDVT